MHVLSLVYFFKYLYVFRAYLQHIIRRYKIWMGCRYARNM